MFTGIIKCLALVKEVYASGLLIKLPREHVITVGESIAINGVCLTVVNVNGKELYFDIANATFECTSLKLLNSKDLVNIEWSLSASDLIGGHFVSGHVDTCEKVTSVTKAQDSWQVNICLSSEYRPFVVPKGSIAINGVSLTIQSVFESGFGLVLVPETIRATNLQFLTEGSLVNVEYDSFAKTMWHQLNLIQGHFAK